jgi:elongation factor G
MPNSTLLSIAIRPKTPADEEKLDHGLRSLVAEDPTIEVTTGQQAGEVIVGATGEQHLEIICDRLKREFDVDAAVGRPQVAYRETITLPADGQAKYFVQLDEGAEYAHVKIRVAPSARGTGHVFTNAIEGGAIPEQFIPHIQAGIGDAHAHGVVAGSPMVDVAVELYDGSYHDVDSSARAFRTAASMAFRDATMKAKPVLLEPVMRVDVTCPAEDDRTVRHDLSRRCARIQSEEPHGPSAGITAHVPFAEMLGYAVTLRDLTRGRGSFTMRLDRYVPCRVPGTDDGDADARVRAPRNAPPSPRDSRIGLPEPEGDASAE